MTKSIASYIARMRNRHFLLFDIIVMAIVPVLALILRLDNAILVQQSFPSLVVYTVAAMAVKLVVYHRFGMYKHLWQYASIEEVSVILVAVFTAGIIFNVFYLLLLPLFPTIPHTIPRSVPAIDLMLSLALHGGIRLASRIYTTQLNKIEKKARSEGSRVLIIGAGNSGSMIAREIVRDPGSGLHPIGFIDDDPKKRSLLIHGLPVLGTRADIPNVCREHGVEQILIAMPSASGRTIQAVLKIIEPLKIKTRTLPGVSELLTESVSLRHLREIRIEDLLRRDPVNTDMASVQAMLCGKRVLVTGAGGSIGSELCRHIAQCQPAEICLLGHGENSIHAVHRELRKKYPDIRFHRVIADIRDDARMGAVFETYRPDFVYHTAAHKHVPLMEENAVDAVTNNILGTTTLLRNAHRCGVGSFTLISTDKAVQPRSVMGATKRLAEIALQIFARQYDVPYSAVRFGNVLGSRGSVVPLFMEQIAAGGPVTITDRNMRRYFMTIHESVQLVLQASTLGGKGDIYVLDMGEPILVLDLAFDLIALSGMTPYKDIQIEFTGLRPGEKLVEQLFREGEVFSRSRHEKIFTVIDKELNGSGSVPVIRRDGLEIAGFEGFEHFIRRTVLPAAAESPLRFAETIRPLVPEFQPFEQEPTGACAPEDLDSLEG
ncbi:MAG: nucleoside-diphosphate sugar epimerase/dehydratase [Bacteroidota bacterium]|nr:nucleoside-diphosphate sugar epimerase/dehydratase [Bacteroidota bacterium]